MRGGRRTMDTMDTMGTMNDVQFIFHYSIINELSTVMCSAFNIHIVLDLPCKTCMLNSVSNFMQFLCLMCECKCILHIMHIHFHLNPVFLLCIWINVNFVGVRIFETISPFSLFHYFHPSTIKQIANGRHSETSIRLVEYSVFLFVFFVLFFSVI